MSNSPLNHKKRGGILGAAAGLFGGRKRKRNSNPNDSNTMNKLQNFRLSKVNFSQEILK